MPAFNLRIDRRHHFWYQQLSNRCFKCTKIQIMQTSYVLTCVAVVLVLLVFIGWAAAVHGKRENKRLATWVAIDESTGFLTGCVAHELLERECDLVIQNNQKQLMAIVINLNSKNESWPDDWVAHRITKATSKSDIPFHYGHGKFVIIIRANPARRIENILTVLRVALGISGSTAIDVLTFSRNESPDAFRKRVDDRLKSSPLQKDVHV
jgi:hypothetical protein